jgi:hypothetical protein
VRNACELYGHREPNNACVVHVAILDTGFRPFLSSDR